MRYLAFFSLLFLLFFAGCSHNGKNKGLFSSESSIDSKSIITDLLNAKKMDKFPGSPVLDDKAIPMLREFYEIRNYKPAWIEKGTDTRQCYMMMGLLSSSMNYGLDTAFYHANTFYKIFRTDSNMPRQFSDTMALVADVAFTYYVMHFATDISVGVLDSGTLQYSFKPEKLKVDLPKYLQKAVSDERHLQSDILALQPPYAEYRQLQKGLTQFLKGKTLSNDSVVIPDNKTDSIGCYAKVRQTLVARHFLDSTQAKNDTLLIKALKNFQMQRGLDVDGKAGKKTRQALAESNLDLYLQMAASLERWRWESGLDSNRAWINLPAYHLKIVQADTVLRIHKLIVGKAETPSPELSSRINYFIINPYWNVPRDISVKEIIPHVLKEPDYLESKHYRVFDRDKKEVDPAKINWKKLNENYFPYSIRRDAGDFNDLGLIKFMFTNAYGVYLHDTPARNLFVRDTRGYSHGCIRMEKPFDFADYLLQRDTNKIQIDSVMKLVAEKVQKTITLKHPMPIYIRYITTEADKDGRLYFYQDIYGRDEKIKDKMLSGIRFKTQQ